MEIRTATQQETAWVSQLKKGGRGRSKGPIRLRVEAIRDEVAVFDGCCDGTLGARCATAVKVRSGITNTQLASPGKKFRHTHSNGAVYVWKVEG